MSDLKWSEVTMAAVNRMTPQIKGKAWNPDWFNLRQRFEQVDELLATKDAQIHALEIERDEARVAAQFANQARDNKDKRIAELEGEVERLKTLTGEYNGGYPTNRQIAEAGLRDERDRLKSELEQAQAAGAVMREALEYCGCHEHSESPCDESGSHYKDLCEFCKRVDQALSTDCGGDMLERLKKLEGALADCLDALLIWKWCRDQILSKTKSTDAFDRAIFSCKSVFSRT